MDSHPLLTEKIAELTAALQQQGLLCEDVPAWVEEFSVGLMTGANFFEWLQFVYLPHILLCGKATTKAGQPFIMLQAKKYIGHKTNYEPIIQLLIEIDAL